MIMLFYDDFFTMPSGKKESYVRIDLSINAKTVIPHPLFSFDHLSENMIYHQMFKPDWQSILSGMAFLEKSSKYARIRADETLWGNTAFWTLKMDSYDYLGIGIRKLEEVIRTRKEGEFFCCLANRDSIIVFFSKFKDNALEETMLDVYVTNTYLPYVEVMQPFREALKNMGKHSVLIEDFADYRNIHKGFYQEEVYLDKPLALIKGSSPPDNNVQVPIMAILNNPFHLRKDASIESLKHFLGQMAGGFLESDFEGKTPFSVDLEIWQLRDIIVADLLYS